MKKVSPISMRIKLYRLLQKAKRLDAVCQSAYGFSI